MRRAIPGARQLRRWRRGRRGRRRGAPSSSSLAAASAASHVPGADEGMLRRRMTTGSGSKPDPPLMRLAITSGDPAGVGPEIIARLLAGFGDGGWTEWRELTVFGAASWLDGLPRVDGVTLVPVGDPGFRAEPGRPSDAGAAIALAAMEAAAAGCDEGRFDAVVTGPVSKSGLQRIGYPYPGQSEFFAARWGGEPTMAFTGGRLRVLLATWHVPLREVPRQLTRAALTR